MIKAPLDEKNISPSQIIDDLTCCNNIGKDNTAVGYINKTSVFFMYEDNVMEIRFKSPSDLLKHKTEIREYVKDMTDNTDMLRISVVCSNKFALLIFYWEDEK